MDLLRKMQRRSSGRRAGSQASQDGHFVDRNFPNSPDRTPPNISPANTPIRQPAQQAPSRLGSASASGAGTGVSGSPGSPKAQKSPKSPKGQLSPGADTVTFCSVSIKLEELVASPSSPDLSELPGILEPRIKFSSKGTVLRSSTANNEIAPGSKAPYVYHYGEELEFKHLDYSEFSGIEIKVALMDSGKDDEVCTGRLVIHEGSGSSLTGTQMASVHLLTPPDSPFNYTVRFEYTLGAMQTETRKRGAKNAPNLLKLTVSTAKDLRANDKGGTSDPYVRLNSGKWEATTSHKQKTLAPAWQERFAIFLDPKDHKQELTLTVMDKNTFMDDLLGEAAIDVRSLKTIEAADHYYTQELVLYAKGKAVPVDVLKSDDEGAEAPAAASPSGPYLGTLTVILEPIFAGNSVDMDRYTQGEINYNVNYNDGEDYDSEEEKLTEEDAAKEQERIKQGRELFEKEMARLEAIEVKEGNYTIMVHIIEVRDLSAEDASGTNDPLVTVEVFGQRKQTKIKKNCNTAIFDDLFYFELKDMVRNDLEAGTIKASVMDADTVSKDFIGAFQTDFEFVYFRPNHELYRAWVALVDNQNSNDSGSQGYLLLTVTILGPGDKPPAHDRKKEMELERKAMAGDEGGLPNVGALMPQVTQSLHFLEVTLYQAMDLPPMDKNLAGGISIDAYVMIKFSDNDAVKSTIVTVKGKSNTGGLLSVAFNERIFIPVLVPTMSHRIEISLWDKDMIKDEIVGSCLVYDFRAVQKGFHQKPFWVPFYGALYPDSNPLYNHEEIDRMNTKSREATTYRGRLLMSLREDLNNGKKKRAQKVIKKALKRRDLVPEIPREEAMVLRCQVYAGYDLPDTDGPLKSSLSVWVCIGASYATTQREKWQKDQPGVVHWNSVIQIPEDGGELIKMPMDVHQLPDIFVYLKKGKGDSAETIGYHRISAAEVYKTNFEQEPFWLNLQRDKANNVCKEQQYPGTLLVRMGFGRRELADSVHWKPIDKLSLKPVRLNVYIYMGRDLCATDDTGLLDPYIKVRFNGQSKQIGKVLQTRNPNFFQTLSFDAMLPDEDHLWPEVTVEAWDWDPGLDPDDFAGSIRVPTQKVFRTSIATFRTKKLTAPKWYPLEFSNPQDAQGELLLNFEVMTKTSADEHVPSPRDITPAKEDVIVEIIPIGLRDLRQKGPIPINKPFVEFRVGDEQIVHCTEGSRLPNTTNPNFRCDIIRIPCQVPTDPLLAPCLNVTVFDKRLGGLNKPILGTTSIPLGPRMKGGPLYKPPGGTPCALNPFLDEPPKAKSINDAPKTPKTPKTPLTGGTQASQGAPWGDKQQQQSDGGVEESKGGEDPAKRNSERLSIFSVGERAGSLIRGAGGLVAGAAAVVTGEGTDAAVGVIEEEDVVEPYLIGREVYTDEMESHLTTTPFEEFGLFHGMKQPGGSMSLFDEPYMRIGYFKGVVRVIRSTSGGLAASVDPLPFEVKELISPATFQVRIYALEARNINAKDVVANNSDPYLKLKLGRTEINDRKNAIFDVVNNAELYRYFEMNAKFPGAGKLEIGVWDKDALGSDSLIGMTVLDLEDRWFSKEWHAMTDQTDPFNPKLTPIESRSLWSPSSTNPQGSLSLWVDILPSKDVNTYEPVNITPPPQTQYELRLTIWKVRNWQEPGDDFTGMTDMFFKARLGAEGDWQNTDTHFRAQTTASFNWRLKFPISLPAKGEGATYLTLQAWDCDILYNDMLVETTFDLFKFFNRGYKKGEAVQYFPLKPIEKKLKLARLTEKLKAAKKEQSNDIDDDAKAAHASFHEVDDSGHSSVPAGQPALSVNSSADIEAGVSNNETDSLIKRMSLSNKYGSSGALCLGSNGGKAKASSSKGKGGSHSRVSSAASGVGSRRASEEAKLLKRKKKITLWDRVKDTMGFGPDPDYAGWVPLNKTVVNKNGVSSVKLCGEVCITMELLPMSAAQKQPVGAGNEGLPKPEGRPDPMAMLNPITLLKTCLGEGLLVKFCGVFLCLGFFVAFIFVGPSFYDLAQICLALPGGWVLMLVCFALMIAGCCFTMHSCAKNCGCSADEHDDDDDDGDSAV